MLMIHMCTQWTHAIRTENMILIFFHAAKVHIFIYFLQFILEKINFLTLFTKKMSTFGTQNINNECTGDYNIYGVAAE
jgi:hypothetical protein